MKIIILLAAAVLLTACPDAPKEQREQRNDTIQTDTINRKPKPIMARQRIRL